MHKKLVRGRPNRSSVTCACPGRVGTEPSRTPGCSSGAVAVRPRRLARGAAAALPSAHTHRAAAAAGSRNHRYLQVWLEAGLPCSKRAPVVAQGQDGSLAPPPRLVQHAIQRLQGRADSRVLALWYRLCRPLPSRARQRLCGCPSTPVLPKRRLNPVVGSPGNVVSL